MLILSQVKNMIMINEESDALQCEMDMDSCSKDKEAVMVLFIVNNKFKRMKLYDVHSFSNFHCNLISGKKLEALRLLISFSRHQEELLKYSK